MRERRRLIAVEDHWYELFAQARPAPVRSDGVVLKSFTPVEAFLPRSHFVVIGPVNQREDVRFQVWREMAGLLSVTCHFEHQLRHVQLRIKFCLWVRLLT
jgi:hypothetical protein